MVRFFFWGFAGARFWRFGLLGLLFAVLLSACAPKTIPVATTPDQPPVATKVPMVVTPPQPSPELPPLLYVPELSQNGLVAALFRTPCFGTCPVFEAQVWDDGTATWKGIKNVARLGSYRAKVPEQWWKQLLEYAEKSTYFELAAQYPLSGRTIPDLPLTVCYLKKGELGKKISDGGDAPLALRQFERYFAEKLEELAWEKVK